MQLRRLRRTNYFAGRLLTSDQLQREQEYFRERLRRHNRALHGWGVVSGLDVEALQNADGTVTVTVTPGYALTPQGDEIVVAEAVSLPLPGTAGRWAVAVRYDERLVDPLPSPAVGPEDQAVQFGATEEGSVIEILQPLPQGPDSPWVLLAELHRAGRGIRVDRAARRRPKRC